MTDGSDHTDKSNPPARSNRVNDRTSASPTTDVDRRGTREEEKEGNGEDRQIPIRDESESTQSNGTATDEAAPLSELAAAVTERIAADRQSEDPFEEIEIGNLDTEALWEGLLSDDEFAVDEHRRDIRVVSKRAYCERCEFFSDPPEVRCLHEGTEIVELVDVSQFKVINCPIVTENERLERGV